MSMCKLRCNCFFPEAPFYIHVWQIRRYGELKCCVNADDWLKRYINICSVKLLIKSWKRHSWMLLKFCKIKRLFCLQCITDTPMKWCWRTHKINMLFLRSQVQFCSLELSSKCVCRELNFRLLMSDGGWVSHWQGCAINGSSVVMERSGTV